MRVLYYNWAPLNLPQAGGGVSLYLYNFLLYLSSHSTPITPVFISSGYYYDNQHKPYIIAKERVSGIENYCLVNSPIIAPHTISYSIYYRHLCDTELVAIFRQFLIEHGPFDVIHFHSFEGLSTKILLLKQEFSTTLFVHTIHDYGLFCPTVRLWTRDSHNCTHNHGFVMCFACVRKELVHRYTDFLIPKRMIDNSIYRMTLSDRIIRVILLIVNRLYLRFSNCFEAVRHQNAQLVNMYSDAELCVSNCVMDIAKKRGIDPTKCVLSYIGTESASSFIGRCRTYAFTPNLTILFMGSSAPEKGLSVLLSALEFIDRTRFPIKLKIAATIEDVSLLNRIDTLRTHLVDIEHYNGYLHTDFDQIMQDVNLGVVPPLWEDNLPQVAIEMVAQGIPVLTSSHGGAHELNTHPAFLFRNVFELRNKIEHIFLHRYLLNDYWSYVCRLTTMEMHVGQLVEIYRHGII